MVDSMERACARCSATAHRMNGKWWCVICRMYVKVKKVKGGR
jgi:hypothetical protein